MVGIVIVSHSHLIAEGVAQLAREMGGPDVKLETAGGLDMPDHPIGTDAVLVMAAIDRAWSDDGVLVLDGPGQRGALGRDGDRPDAGGAAGERAALRGADRGGRGGSRRHGEAGSVARSRRARGARRTGREDRAPGRHGRRTRGHGVRRAPDGRRGDDPARRCARCTDCMPDRPHASCRRRRRSMPASRSAI